jgi:heme A synthase
MPLARNFQTNARFTTFAWFVIVFNILVILWGAFVRASGSGDGCGDNWPLCNQQVIPTPQRTATLIEFFHRTTSGLALLLVVAQLIYSFRAFPKGHLARTGAKLSFLFIIVESLLGAGLVLFRLVGTDQSIYRVFAMVTHQINTLLLLGSMTLTVFWSKYNTPIDFRSHQTATIVSIIMLVGMALLGITGATTALADTLFPSRTLIEGLLEDLNDSAHITVQMRWLHPVIALAFWLFITFACNQLKKLKDDENTAFYANTLPYLMLGQLALGTLNLALLTPIWLQIVHLLMADSVWIIMVLLIAHALRKEESR